MTREETYMSVALKEAKKAYKIGETPIGACVVYKDEVIAKAYNLREKRQDTLAHAEALAIQKACKKLGTWRLEECELYVTLEPCVMCSGAIIQSRIKNVYYGAKNQRFGCHQSAIRLFDVEFNHKVNVTSGILELECSKLISDFFKELRNSRV